IIAAVFGGSNYQISGPTGAMAVILAPIVAAHGARVVPLLCLMAGLMILLAGVLGLGRAVSLIPWPVIEGFTVGIAAILFFQQVPNIIGVEARAGLSTLPAAFEALTRITPTTALTTGLLCLTAVIIIAACAKISKKLPGSLIAVVIVSVGAWGAGLTVPSIGTIPAA
ncbi:SulP family inorganic anion transporter, partial [Actinotignum sp. GS-2025b]